MDFFGIMNGKIVGLLSINFVRASMKISGLLLHDHNPCTVFFDTLEHPFLRDVIIENGQLITLRAITKNLRQ